jgi:hypothetical protein
MIGTRLTYVLTLTMMLPGAAIAQAPAPIAIAFQSPDCNHSDPGYIKSECDAFQQNILPYVSGIGVTVPWSFIDKCNSGNTHCSGDNSTCSGNVYQWCDLDGDLIAYITNSNGGNFAGKKIILIVEPETDTGGVNALTPAYVFTSAWANMAGNIAGESCAVTSTCPPQDMAVCQAWKGDSGAPYSGSFTSANAIVWNTGGSCYPVGTGLACSGPYSDTSGFPIVYETPITIAYQEFLQALALHYSTANTVAPNGATIAPYIAYVRAGMAAGGENNPMCTMTGAIPVPDWAGSQTLPAAYMIQPTAGNPGSYQYLTDTSGTTGPAASEPTWCQTAGCYTSPDGTISRWHNVGPAAATGNAVWPGPEGQTEAKDYIDNGYLSTWSLNSPTSSDGTGYIASMVSFLSGLNASFPWTISSHVGPPFLMSYAYPDAEATLAAQAGVGFGMQSLSVWDGELLSLGVYPTSRNDWVANFQKYPNAPVRHLQLYAPGNDTWWSGYPIVSITVASGGTATVNCGSGVDCAPFEGEYVFITGNANPSLNTAWPVSCISGGCTDNEVQFSAPLITPGTYDGGNLFSANYWPVTLPFAVREGATSVELWECDIDYAFNQVTFPTGSSGCNPESVGGGLVGPDPNYQNALANTLNGQPKATGVHSGITNGTVTQF